MKIRKALLVVLICQATLGFGQVELPNTLSVADKVYGLSRFWQEANYNFVYLDKVDKVMWENAYKKCIERVIQTPNDYEYYRELQKFCALLKDGHTNVNMPQKLQALQMNTMFGEYRFFLKNVAGSVVVERVNASKKDEIPVGSEIVEVNGLSTAEYMNRFVKPYISSSTDYVLDDYAASNLLKGLENETFQIKLITPNRSIKSLTVTHRRSTEEEVYPPFGQDSLLVFRWLPNNIAYVALNSFADNKINQQIEQLLPELYKAKALVLDLRNNGGGNTGVGTDILRYLTNDKVLHHARYSTREHRAAFKAWGVYTTPKDTVGNSWNTQCYLYNQGLKYYDFEYKPEPIRVKAKRLVVPTAVLTSHQTASAAEDFLISADNQKHFVKIGERTYGSTGQPYLFVLPGGGSARICTKKDTYPDGREFVGVGILPDIEVIPSLQDYITNRDAVLERAVEHLVGKLK